MPPRKQYVLDNKTARIILSELDEYAKMRQFYPLEHSLYTYLTEGEPDPKNRKKSEARYPELKGRWGMFHHWFGRLVEDGFIEIDQTTRAVRCVHLQIIEKDTSPLA